MNAQSPTEEKWNWITHGFGLILSILGLLVLISENAHRTVFSTFAIIVYGITLLVLYFASTAYHYATNSKLKRKLRVMDHVGIYLLIAGTYTPVTLITLLDSKGKLLFFLVWSFAIIGSILKLFFTGKFQILSIILYVVMGWLIILDINMLTNKIGADGIAYLSYGGASYMIGILFYVLKRMSFSHVIWHLFVLAGSIFHYILIYKYVI
ncbi:hemolysin III family protein [Aquimarina sp. AD10]|uniref:PAQR family membrane homeostasis protein TrhA n=1 Tax=Aquimarina sp. AD10 TaxID=1714849 RepID=UPI000E50E8AA|nr:hemolysin III family protein [Aquimarina sp. AD10]AXT59101.1 hemolysin III family protein [Aquimarina sp. AD10]RKM93111.1 hemolysin III family protein [Aquimarina sp. AD10]